MMEIYPLNQSALHNAGLGLGAKCLSCDACNASEAPSQYKKCDNKATQPLRFKTISAATPKGIQLLTASFQHIHTQN